MSGISGSGKDTWIENQPWLTDAVVMSADKYFMQDGKYCFDPAKLSCAHSACLLEFIEACMPINCDNTNSVLVVNNTNLNSEEIAPYYAISKAYGLDVELVTLFCSPEVALRNTHGVPLHTLERMDKKLWARTLPPFWQLGDTRLVWNGLAGYVDQSYR